MRECEELGGLAAIVRGCARALGKLQASRRSVSARLAGRVARHRALYFSCDGLGKGAPQTLMEPKRAEHSDSGPPATARPTEYVPTTVQRSTCCVRAERWAPPPSSDQHAQCTCGRDSRLGPTFAILEQALGAERPLGRRISQYGLVLAFIVCSTFGASWQVPEDKERQPSRCSASRP
jgi:hypothetical protein